MRLDYRNVFSTILAALVIGLCSYYYSSAEEVKQLKSDLAVIKSESDRSKEDIKEIKQDVKEMKQDQAKVAAEQTSLLKEILAESKKSKKQY